MIKALNPFKKIDVNHIELQLTGESASFSYTFTEKQEKELNFSAGRIHRKTTSGTGSWTLEGYTLTTTYSMSKLVDSRIEFGASPNDSRR